MVHYEREREKRERERPHSIGHIHAAEDMMNDQDQFQILAVEFPCYLAFN